MDAASRRLAVAGVVVAALFAAVVNLVGRVLVLWIALNRVIRLL